MPGPITSARWAFPFCGAGSLREPTHSARRRSPSSTRRSRRNSTSAWMPSGSGCAGETRGKELDIEIVGLAKNAKYSEVKSEINPVVVMPYRQDENLSFANFYVRTQHDEQQLLSMIPGVIRRLDPNLPVARIRTMETEVQRERVAGSFRDVDVRRLRGACDAACRDWSLRSAGVHRHATHAGVRSADGARRRHIECAEAGSCARSRS